MEDEYKDIQRSEFIEDSHGHAFHGCVFMLVVDVLVVAIIYALIKLL